MQFHLAVEIIVKDRVRKDFGDLQSLADSIAEVGLLQPIGITADLELVFGERRLRAVRDILRWRDIPTRTVNLEAIVLGEYAENELRKDFTPSERVEIGKKIEEWLGNRQGQRTDLELPRNCAEVEKGETRDIAASRAGFGSGDSYERARKVVEHGAPELVEAMDSGAASISAAAEVAALPIEEQKEIVAKGETEILRAAKEIKQARREENARQRAEVKSRQMAIPDGKYSCIVIDPPWPMEKIERDERPSQVGFEYPTMSEQELKAFPLPEIAADDCHLYLWTTHKFLPMALRLAEHWGFRYQCLMTWVKNVGFTPFSWMYSTEHVLFCRKGSLPLEKLGMRLDFSAKVREHSRKPDEFYELIRQASPGPRLDVFSREAREGFEQFGNETAKFQEDAA